MTSFSLIWIGDKVSVIIDNDEYGFYEFSEKSDSENKTENKLKTQFISEIEILNFAKITFLNPKKNNSLYLFKVKEFCSENHTPPPEV